ncbi:MAG: sigma-70 family RNA polymerase sigma factor [Bacteroidales bacterium]|jgi:RNA polymerase sigma-70 factor (ECF subfamily)
MDEIYIQQVLRGNIHSYRYLVEKYKNMVFTIARNITKDDLVAEEVAQDSFLKAFQNLEKFRKRSKFSTWLYKIVVNESMRKTRKRKLPFEHLNDVEPNDNLIRIEPEAIGYLHEEEQKEMICNILNTLTTSESLILRLFYLEELNLKEVSKITGFSLSNVKVILYRARRKFAARVKKSASLIQ